MDYCIRTYKDQSQIEHSKSILEESNSAILEQSELLSLAGNPTRLKILVLISHDEELCVCDFSSDFFAFRYLGKLNSLGHFEYQPERTS